MLGWRQLEMVNNVCHYPGWNTRVSIECGIAQNAGWYLNYRALRCVYSMIANAVNGRA